MTTVQQPAPAAQAAKKLTLYKPGEVAPSQGICIYGRSGIGKTTLIGTMPGKGLLIDVPQLEGGTEVLEGHDNIDIALVTTWEEIDEPYWMLAREKHDYKWVAVDSITAMQKLAKRKVVKERDISADPHKTTLEEYGKIGSLVEELVYRFRRLPLFTIWTAQERKFTTDGEPTIVGPDVLPSALNALMPSMLMVARLKPYTSLSGADERHLCLTPRPGHYAKTRLRPSVTVPSMIKNANLTTLLLHLRGNKDAQLEEAGDDSMIALDLGASFT